MPKVRCLRFYVNRELAYRPGAVFEATDDQWAFLQRDSPGSFELATVKEIAEPPQDKAVKAPPRSKAMRGTRSRRKADATNES